MLSALLSIYKWDSWCYSLSFSFRLHKWIYLVILNKLGWKLPQMRSEIRSSAPSAVFTSFLSSTIFLSTRSPCFVFDSLIFLALTELQSTIFLKRKKSCRSASRISCLSHYPYMFYIRAVLYISFALSLYHCCLALLK